MRYLKDWLETLRSTHHVLSWSVASETWLENFPLGYYLLAVRKDVGGLRCDVAVNCGPATVVPDLTSPQLYDAIRTSSRRPRRNASDPPMPSLGIKNQGVLEASATELPSFSRTRLLWACLAPNACSGSWLTFTCLSCRGESPRGSHRIVQKQTRETSRFHTQGPNPHRNVVSLALNLAVLSAPFFGTTSSPDHDIRQLHPSLGRARAPSPPKKKLNPAMLPVLSAPLSEREGALRGFLPRFAHAL
ncbi:unnamed protein product [Symbiodinium natans]|uniref:Uncharacterized protein n=1 Tax=Symbiodinium natans TaxID=878477 RepID=A0A812GRU7_9DINO|nr:unnamed protein product [Symbiodinium natans]